MFFTTREWNKCGVTYVTVCGKCIWLSYTSILYEKNSSYDRSCYEEFAKNSKFNYSMEWYEKAVKYKTLLCENRIGQTPDNNLSIDEKNSNSLRKPKSSARIFYTIMLSKHFNVVSTLLLQSCL